MGLYMHAACAAYVDPPKQRRWQLLGVLLASHAQAAVATNAALAVELALAVAREPDLARVGQSGLADLHGSRVAAEAV